MQSAPHIAIEARWKGILGRHTARVSNFSVIGCYLETSGEAHNREVVEVELMKPDGGWITLQGQVIYRLPEGGFAVFFIEMNKQVRRAVAEIIDYAAGEAKELFNDRSETVN